MLGDLAQISTSVITLVLGQVDTYLPVITTCMCLQAKDVQHVPPVMIKLLQRLGEEGELEWLVACLSELAAESQALVQNPYLARVMVEGLACPELAEDSVQEVLQVRHSSYSDAVMPYPPCMRPGLSIIADGMLWVC